MCILVMAAFKRGRGGGGGGGGGGLKFCDKYRVINSRRGKGGYPPFHPSYPIVWFTSGGWGKNYSLVLLRGAIHS